MSESAGTPALSGIWSWLAKWWGFVSLLAFLACFWSMVGIVIEDLSGVHPALFAGVSLAVYAAFLGVHELGHVLAGLLLGERLDRVVSRGFGVGVSMSGPRPRTHAGQVLVSLCGPGLQLAVAAPLAWVVFSWSGTFAHPVVLAAVLACGDAVVNLIPFPFPSAISDGGKAVRSLWFCLLGRWNHPAWCPPPEIESEAVSAGRP